MIDPSIALSYHPQVQPQSPIDAFGQAMALKSQANQQQLQQQSIQQNDLQIKTNAALNAAIQKNTTQAADGSVTVDHSGVQKTMADLGFANAGQQYAENQKKTNLELDKLTSDQLLQKAQVQRSVNDALSAARSITDPAKRQAFWTDRRNWAIQNMQADPKAIPEQVPDDATLGTYEQLGMDSLQRVQTRIQQQQANTAEKREEDNARRTDGYYQWMMKRGDVNRYRFTNQYDKDNHPIILDTQDGKVLVDKNVTGAPWADPAGARGRGVTPDAALTENRANQNDYEKNASAENTAASQRNALDAALTKGKTYVYANGRTVPFSSMKNSDGSPLSADDQAALQAEMQQRKVSLEKGIETAVSNKNNAMQRNGVRPQISTQDAISNYRKGWGYRDQAQGGGAEKPPDSTIAQMPVNKIVTFRNGTKWIKGADGSVQQVTP